VLQCAAVCCSVLQCVAVCCSVLQCVAVCCSVLQCVAVCCSVLQCVAVCCSVLQCVAVCYLLSDSFSYAKCHIYKFDVLHVDFNKALQHTATHCNCCRAKVVLHVYDFNKAAIAVRCSVLQCDFNKAAIAVRCSVLQCVAVCCSVILSYVLGALFISLTCCIHMALAGQ